jgi:hypothetical protein
MAKYGFCGPTYQSVSRNINAERAINLYPEAVEMQPGKFALLGTPGLKLFANLGSSAVLGQFSCRPNGAVTDRLFAVVQSGINQVLFEVFQDGTFASRGMLNAPTTPIVTMAHNGTQLLICTGGQLWVLDLSANTLALATAPPSASIEMVQYSDGFGIALQQNSNKFWVSDLLDFNNWGGLSVAQVSEFPDNIVSMIVNQRQIAFLGTKQSVVYANAGAAQEPFLPIQGAFVENGCCAPFASARLDNSVVWLDQDERGQGVARRANGYTPVRISNHSVEAFWNTYPTIADAISYTYIESGHSFWVIYFPSGIGADGIPGQGATWAFDAATGMWHERAFWNAQKGYFQAHHSQNHAFAWGAHFVGDRQSGNLYRMGSQFLDDAGANIERVRVAPNLTDENEWKAYHEVTIDLETGLGPQPPLTGPSTAPTSYLIGDDSGNTFALSMSDVPELQFDAATGAAGGPILNDQATATSWQLKIVYDAGNNPHLDFDKVPYDMRGLGFLPFSTPSGKYTFIYIQNGNIQIEDAVTAARDPQLHLRWSKDHAHTWSNRYILDCGQAGKFTKRVVKRRLGRARTMTIEVRVSDPVPWRFVDSYIKVSA